MSAAVPDPPPALVAAREFAARGWRPFPVEYGGKRPAVGIRWGTATAGEQADDTLVLWFGRNPVNVGIAAKGSGLVILDEDQLGAMVRLCEDYGRLVPVTYRVRTAKGWHWYFTAPAGAEIGNAAGLLADYGFDVRGGRGDGGYVVAAGSVHASGHVYAAEDPHAKVIELPDWLVELLLPEPDQPVTEGFAGETDRDRRYTLDQAAEWITRYAVEPLKASVEGHRNDALNTAAVVVGHFVPTFWPTEWAIDRLTELAEEVGLDQSEIGPTIRSGLRAGMAAPYTLVAARDPFASASDSSGRGSDAESTWRPVELGPYLRGERKPSAPEIGLRRHDGMQLLYPGKEHAVIGEMESGKSWLSLACVVAELAEGRTVVYVHFEEDDPTDTIERLQLLGATTEQIEQRFVFVAPESAVSAEAMTRLTALRPSLVVLDGQNEAMALHGLGIREEDGAAAYRRLLVKPFTAAGAAVLSCDHVVKDSEKSARGYALGSIHKGNGLNGTLILLENEEPFGRGLRGASRVYVTKDRPGQVRQHGKPTGVLRKFFLGVLAVDATDSEQLDLAFWPPRSDAEVRDVLLNDTNWHDVLSADAVVPDEVAMLRAPGAGAARDVFRVLRYVGGEDGLTTSELRSALSEGPREHKRSSLFAARSLLLEKGICEEGSTRSRIVLTAKFGQSVRTDS